METNLFESIFKKVDTALDTYIMTVASDMITFITPIFTSLMIIWIAIWGYMLMVGRSNEPLVEGLFRIVRVGFIISLGLTVGTYNDIVVNFLIKGPESIASIVTGTPEGTSAIALDTLFTSFFEISKAAWDKGGVLNGNFGLYLIAIAILLVGVGLTLVVAFLLLVSKIMATVLLAIGPLFIVMLLFNATQRFFESWLGMVLNYGFVLVLAAAVGKIVITIADSYITSMGNDASTLANLGDASMLCTVFALCILVMRQVTPVASALGGGVALATQGAISSAMNAMRPTTIKKQTQRLRRDGRHALNTLKSPANAVNKGRAAYQNRFGSGNSISQK